MSKVKQYIEEAVAATADQLKAKGCEISNVHIDSGVHVTVDNGDAIKVLLALARAQTAIANAVVATTKAQPAVHNNSTGINLQGIDDRPRAYKVAGEM